jgi:cystathionine gamma-lyase
VHVGGEPDPTTGAVAPPIHLATTYVQAAPGDSGRFDYSRSGNPTRALFERAMADLEGGYGGLAFSSGMAAIHNVMMLLEPGDAVVAGADIYGGTYRLLHNVCARGKVRTTLVPTCDLDRVERALDDGVKLLWLESPGNPLLSVTDLAACIEIARRRGILVGVDNTFATTALTRPIEFGADFVVHSATKYIGGHSDVLGGATVVREKSLWDRLYFLQNATGAVMAPLESYLCLRGLRTLELRVREQCRSAQAIAEHLARSPQVRRVYYPGLPDHPGHHVAARQMHGGFGGILSFEVEGGFERARKVAGATRLFQLAVSLGAVESLIEQPASMSHASYAREDRLRHGISDGLIRLSVGLEDPDDLKADLDRALAV